ncbi:phthiocerol/phthiodiolone dimycocerosyl transferase family protein [Segniliparus rugosus]|uniref:Phthiocerol/phthiodiolone dimycocerosyl transferase n=1 Tax=Segniliparus rugosus (strain ATCC BAA-974 / DSM 45345 / CCUG 50838 / CIP 108380 / JCM 13579 / CDC 945) TaxID=679197 RepID=E5XKJ0_SEGRC|nr:hypothetical protein [Segniliparus rugosus]EFV15102.2 hypothetical protein HMPREF9336_00009 [Segniliparus rugosus ATCC BAA-974]
MESDHQLDARRPLSRSELGWAALRYYFSGVLSGEGALDEEIMRQALAALTAKYPFLGAQVVLGDQGFEFVLPAGNAEPVFTFEKGDVDAPISPEQGSLPDGKVAGVRVISDGDRFKIVFIGHHAGADARLVMQYGFELFAYYTGLSLGSGFEGGSFHGLPSSPELVLEEYGVPALDPSEYFRRSYGEQVAEQILSNPAEPKQPPAPAVEDSNAEDSGSPRLVSSSLHLSEEQTRAVKDAAKRAGVTVHAVVCAAAVLAEFLLDESSARRFVVLRTAVDARGRTVPPIGNPASVTNFAGASIALFAARRDDDPTVWAEHVLKQVNSDTEHGMVPVSVRLLPELLGTLQRMRLEDGSELCRISISNVGVMPTLPAPEGLRLTTLDAHMEADPIPGLIPRSGRTSGSERNYGVMTYAGRLRMRLFLLDRPQSEVDQVIEALGRAFAIVSGAVER